MVYPNRVVLNINQKYVIPIPYTQQGDTARVLTFSIFDKGVPFNLTGKTVRAKIVKPDKTKCYNDLAITNATNGECTLKLTNQILAVAGNVNCQLEIKEGEELLSTIIFPIDVEPSIDINGAVESTNEFTALLNGIIKLDEWDKYFKETSGSIEEKYTERLNGIDSSLEDISYNVKDFGAKGDGIADDTIAIQSAIIEGGTGKKIIFDKCKKYKVSSTIFVPVGTILEFNYSTIIPTQGNYTNDYVFSLNSSDVQTWDEQYPYKFVEINHLISDNVNLIPNLKLIFSACPLRTEDMYSRRYFGTIKTPQLYIDLFDLKHIMIVDHMSSSSYAIEKSGQGDAIQITGVHCINYLPNAYLNGVSINGSCGCIINTSLNGNYKISNCESLSINNSHFEKGTISVIDSGIEINNSYMWKKPNESCLSIIDTQYQHSGNINRPITLNNLVFRLKYHQYQYTSDFSEIDITNFGGLIVLNNCYRECESYDSPYAYSYNTGISIKYDTNKSILANSNKIKIINKKIINEKIINGTTDDGYYFLTGVSLYENPNITFKGLQTTYYYKVISLLDENRMLGTFNNVGEKSVVVNSVNSYVKLAFSDKLLFQPIVRIYRGTSSGVYTHYVDIPYLMSRGLFDTGEDINGFVWKENTSNSFDKPNKSFSICFNGDNIISHGNAKPTNGDWKKGDIVINTIPSIGGYIGWVCTESGKPGTWKGYGIIES